MEDSGGGGYLIKSGFKRECEERNWRQRTQHFHQLSSVRRREKGQLKGDVGLCMAHERNELVCMLLEMTIDRENLMRAKGEVQNGRGFGAVMQELASVRIEKDEKPSSQAGIWPYCHGLAVLNTYL